MAGLTLRCRVSEERSVSSCFIIPSPVRGDLILDRTADIPHHAHCHCAHLVFLKILEAHL